MRLLRKRFVLFSFIFLLVLGFAVRLYRFNNPIADWHSWRQADTSSVARNFVEYGFDLLHPRMNNISNVQSGLENPQGYFYTEFPLYDGAQAGFYKAFGYFTLEEWGRLITISMSLMGSIFLFLLLYKRNKTAAWLAFVFNLFLPYNIYYGRTILPDMSMVAMVLGGLYFFDLSVREVRIKYWCLFISLIFTAIALLLKPYALFYGLVFFVLAWNTYKFKTFLRIELWIFAFLSIAPLAWWRHYMLSYPEGIPASSWLFNGNNIRFHPAFFRWIFYERIIKLISGFFNALFILAGLVGISKSKTKKDILFLSSFVLAATIYVCVIATGNVQHDYYQIVIIPPLAMLMGYGVVWVISFLQKYIDKKFTYLLVAIFIGLGFYFSFLQVKDYFNINNPAIVEAGKAVDRLTPKNAKVLAPYDGDSSFLYQTNRQGWASFEHDLPTLIKMGCEYLVLVHPTPQDIALGKQYEIVAQTPDYILFNLHKKP